MSAFSGALAGQGYRCSFRVLAMRGRIALQTDRPDVPRTPLGRDRELFLLAVAEDAVIRSLIGLRPLSRSDVCGWWLTAALRRRGVARLLVQSVEASLRSFAAERITILVLKDEPGAPEFWKSVGYETDSVIERYAKDLR
jgi:ribosomal protein S18 acetylase RimI-like enzyme